MKRFLIAAVAAAGIVIMAGAAFAASIGGTVTVQATIVGQCKVIGANNITQTSDFGTITVDETTADQSNPLTGTSIRCTNGLPYTISYALSGNASGAQRRMKYTDGAATDHFLNYSFTPATAAGSYTGAGFGAGSVNIGGTVGVLGTDLQAAWTDSSVGVAYSDAVVVDLAF